MYLKHLMMAKTTQLIFELLDTEKDRLFQYASYRLHNISDVEDALQNMYVKILENPERFDSVANRRAYLYRILTKECTDQLRRKANVDPLPHDSMATLDIESLQPENFEEEFEMVNRLLGILPAEQSEAIRLRHHSNLSFREIAEIMDVPLPTAQARYRYGIEKIRYSLKKLNLL